MRIMAIILMLGGCTNISVIGTDNEVIFELGAGVKAERKKESEK